MRFVRPGEVVLAWTEDETDPQYAMSLADLKVLEQETDAKGRKFKIHKLPIPQKPVCLTQEDVDGFVFEEEKTNGKQENGWLPVT